MIVFDVAKVKRRRQNKEYYKKNRERRRLQYKDKLAELPPPEKTIKDYFTTETGKFVLTFT